MLHVLCNGTIPTNQLIQCRKATNKKVILFVFELFFYLSIEPAIPSNEYDSLKHDTATLFSPAVKR